MTEMRVQLFARLRELAGSNSVTVELPSSPTVADLRSTITTRVAALADWLPRCAIAINGEYAEDSAAIPPNCELAILPPVSGG
jgi:molybdopterin converting factor subunit 1